MNLTAAGKAQDEHVKRFITTAAETFSLLVTPTVVLQSMQTTRRRMLRLMMSLKSSECSERPCTDLTLSYLHIANTSVHFDRVHVPCRDDIQDEDFEAGGDAQQSYSMLHAFSCKYRLHTVYIQIQSLA